MDTSSQRYISGGAVFPGDSPSGLMLRADCSLFTSQPGLAQIQQKNSTTEEKETRERLVERSVAQPFYWI
jgi:hypothetical protein